MKEFSVFNGCHDTNFVFTDLLMRNYGLLSQVLLSLIISFSIADSGSSHTTENDEKSMPDIICFIFILHGNYNAAFVESNTS